VIASIFEPHNPLNDIRVLNSPSAPASFSFAGTVSLISALAIPSRVSHSSALAATAAAILLGSSLAR
jgi:hypothetical protein